MFKRLQIGTKIMLLAASILCLLLIVILWGINGLTTTVHNGEEMAAGNHLSAELLQMEVDHLNWSKKISAFLTDENATELDVQTDHTRCGMGKWLYGEGRKHAELLVPSLAKDLKALEVPHRRLHESAQKIKDVFRAADPHLPQFLTAKELDHVLWLSAIKTAIIDGDSELDVEFDHKNCDFGKFLFGEAGKKAAADNPKLAKILNDIKAPHEALHKNAQMLAAFMAAGNMNDAAMYFTSSLVPALESTRELLHQAEKAATDALKGQKQAHDIFTGETQNNLHEVQKILHNMEKTVSANILSDAQLIATASQTKTAITYIGIIALLIGIVLAYFISKSITGPLKKVFAVVAQDRKSVV